MATWASILSEIRTDVLKDTGATQNYSDAQLLNFANSAIRMSFPLCFVYTTDTSTTTTQTAGVSTYTDTIYGLPSGVPTYPNQMPIRSIEIGPIGGERISDSLASSDRYQPIHGWGVNWGARKLELPYTPPYDTGTTYRYRIRFRYISAIPTLAATTDSFTGPDAFINVILEWALFRAMENKLRSALTEAERLSGIGSVKTSARDMVSQMIRDYGCRMQIPPLVGWRGW